MKKDVNVSEVLESMKFDTKLQGANVGQEYFKQRGDLLTTLNDVVIEGKKLKEMPQQFLEDLGKALKSDDEEFSTKIQKFSEIYKKMVDSTQQPDFSLPQLSKQIPELQKEAKDILNKHLNNQYNLVETYLGSKSADIAQYLRVTANDERVKHAIDAIKNQLSKEQEKILNETLKVIQTDHKNTLDALEKEFARLVILSRHHSTNKKFRELVNKSGLTALSVGFEADMFKPIDMASIQSFKSYSNRDIHQQNNTFTMKFPSTLLSPSYYKNKFKKDIDDIATAIKATGATKITLNVTYADKSFAKKAGMECYASARAAGFPEDKITIIINGEKFTNEKSTDKEVKTLDALFSSNPNKKQAAELEADARKSQRERFFTSNASDYRKNLEKLKQAQQPAQTTPANPTPNTSNP